MRIAIDFDGVISANFQHYFQLASDFIKSGHKVYVLTAARHDRVKDIITRLIRLNFPIDEVISRPKDFISTPYNIGVWKKQKLIQYDIDLWFDNEIKAYEQAGVDFSDIKDHIIIVKI